MLEPVPRDDEYDSQNSSYKSYSKVIYVIDEESKEDSSFSKSKLSGSKILGMHGGKKDKPIKKIHYDKMEIVNSPERQVKGPAKYKSEERKLESLKVLPHID